MAWLASATSGAIQAGESTALTDNPPVLVAQISDLHIKPRGMLAYGRVDSAAALTACIAALNRLSPRPGLAVITGDLVDKALPEEYDHLKALLAPLRIPFAAVPGNHDDAALMRRAFPKRGDANQAGALNSRLRVGPLDVVLVDSSVLGKPHGELSDATLTWLDQTLAAEPERPALLFLHHPPFVTGIAHMDVQNLRNAAALARVVTRHARVLLVAAGHVHRSVTTSFAGIPATICPAPNHAVALDLEARLPPSFNIEPPGFHLHAWFPGGRFGSVVTHLVPIAECAGPFPFFGAGGNLL